MKLSEGAVCLPKLHFPSFWILKDFFPPPARNRMIKNNKKNNNSRSKNYCSGVPSHDEFQTVAIKTRRTQA